MAGYVKRKLTLISEVVIFMMGVPVESFTALSSMEPTFGKPEAFCDPEEYFLITKNMIWKEQMLLAVITVIIDSKVQSQSDCQETMSVKPSLGMCEWVGTKFSPLLWDLGVRFHALSLEMKSCWHKRRIKKRPFQELRCLEANCITIWQIALGALMTVTIWIN